MSDEFLPIPIPDDQRITELWAWIAVHHNGGEGLVMFDFHRHGKLQLVTQSEETAHMVRWAAERAAQSPDVDRVELRRFVLPAISQE